MDFKRASFIVPFLVLATIITLFPPYNWGEEKLKDRDQDYPAYLPIKKRDFLFSGDKKNIFVYNVYPYFHTYDDSRLVKRLDGRPVNDNLWQKSDILFSIPECYKTNKVIGKKRYIENWNVKTGRMIKNPDYTVKKPTRARHYRPIPGIYDDLRPAYDKNLDEYNRQKKIDTSYLRYTPEYKTIGVPYTEITVEECVYMNLNRKLITSELFLEYFLAGLLSALFGFLYSPAARYFNNKPNLFNGLRRKIK